MILKKPYAFLIKKFRIIHLILTFLIGFVIYRSTLIVNFFIEYIKNNYKSSVLLGLGSVYTPFYLFFTVLVIVLLSFAIYYLLKHKNKPIKLYLFMILYYILLFIGLMYIKSKLGNLAEELLSTKLSRSLRDFSIISIVPQVIFFVFCFIRTIGFNIKKFNFQSDLKEINYGFEDSEEVEVNINLNSYKYKRSIRRALREFIYYLKENKLFVIIILSIVAVVLIIFLIKNKPINYDKTYSTGKQFTYNDVQFTINDSMITNLDYNGNILEQNSYYVVLNVSLSNNSGITKHIDFNLFNLIYSNKNIKPILSESSYFIDYAPENVISSFAHRTNKTFALVYKIDAKDINKRFKLDIYNGSVYNKKEYTSKHIYVRLNPKKYINVSLLGNYKMGEKIKFNDTFLGNTSLKIKNYEINKTYFYTYEKCFKNNCDVYDDVITVPYTQQRHNNYILTLNIDYIIDENTLYGKSNTLPSIFADKFIKIKYKVNDIIYTDDFINVTPAYSNNFLAFEVNKNINSASIIQVIITIRNKMYIINLKS